MALGLVGLPFLFAMVRAAFYVAVAAIFLGLNVRGRELGRRGGHAGCHGGGDGGARNRRPAFVLVVKRGDLVTGMILFAMGFISGAVFPVSVLPDWIQPLGEIVPTRFAFDGLRAALFEGTGWYGDALALAGSQSYSFPLAIWLFARALLLDEATRLARAVLI